MLRIHVKKYLKYLWLSFPQLHVVYAQWTNERSLNYWCGYWTNKKENWTFTPRKVIPVLDSGFHAVDSGFQVLGRNHFMYIMYITCVVQPISVYGQNVKVNGQSLPSWVASCYDKKPNKQTSLVYWAMFRNYLLKEIQNLPPIILICFSCIYICRQ